MNQHAHIADRTISFRCDFRLESKQRARHGKGRTFTPAKTVAFERAVGFIARSACTDQTPFTGKCSVEIYATFTPPKSTAKKRLPEIYGKPYTSRSDADNQIKAVCDALNGIIYDDDRQVSHVAIRRHYGPQDAFRVTVMELPE